MDVTELLNSNLTIDLVESAPVKKLVILSGGAMKQMPDGKSKLNLLVEFGGRQINWIPNRTTMRNIAEKYGKETTAWLGKAINLKIGIVNNKEAVIGEPV